MFHRLGEFQPDMVHGSGVEEEEVFRSMGELDQPPQAEPGSEAQPSGPTIRHL